MSSVTFDQAKEWLEKISSKDSVAIIHDVDPDGTCSGIIAMDFCEKKKAFVEEFGFYRGTSSFNDIDLSKFNKIIILDLNDNLLEGVESKLQEKEFLYIDHHGGKESKYRENILEYRTVNGICTSRSIWELCGGKEWLAIVGAYSDAGEKYGENKTWFDKFTSKIDMNLENFKENYIWLYGTILLYFKKDTKKAFNLIRSFKDWKDIRKYEKYWGPVEEEKKKLVEDFYKKHEKLGSAKYFYFEPNYDLKSVVINVISYAEPESTFIFAIPKDSNKIGISARSQIAKYDMNDLLRTCIKGFENSGAGGHPAAAGAWFQEKDLPKFKENVKNYLKNLK